MNWNNIIIFFSICIILRFVINYYKYRKVVNLLDEYNQYIVTTDMNFVQKIPEIKALFKEAGIEDFMVIHQEFMGFGNYANIKLSGLDNMTSNRLDIVTNVVRKFNETIGVFRKRYKDSLNPIFWIEYVIKLPQYLLEFFGVLPEKIVVKIFLMIYWIIAIIFGLTKFEILDYLIK